MDALKLKVMSQGSQADDMKVLEISHSTMDLHFHAYLHLGTQASAFDGFERRIVTVVTVVLLSRIDLFSTPKGLPFASTKKNILTRRTNLEASGSLSGRKGGATNRAWPILGESPWQAGSKQAKGR